MRKKRLYSPVTAIGANRLTLLILIFFFTLIIPGCGNDNKGTHNSPFAGAKLVVSHGPMYDFGSVELGEFRNEIFIVQNIGALDATELASDFLLSVHFSFSGGSFPGTGGDCATVLVAGALCKVEVRFAPQWVGNLDGQLRINYKSVSRALATGSPLLRGKGRGPAGP